MNPHVHTEQVWCARDYAGRVGERLGATCQGDHCLYLYSLESKAYKHTESSCCGWASENMLGIKKDLA